MAYDGTVRDASDRIVQFKYGDDGVDAVHIVRLKIPPLQEEWIVDDMEYARQVMLRTERQQCLESDSYLKVWSKRHGEDLVSCPVDVAVLYERARMMSGNKFEPASVESLWDSVQKLLAKIDIDLFGHFLVLFLQTKNLLKLSTTFADWFLGIIEERFDRCKINPGEMVGVLAGQSVAEPSTQMQVHSHRSPLLKSSCAFILTL